MKHVVDCTKINVFMMIQSENSKYKLIYMLWLRRSMKLSKFTSHKKKNISFIERRGTIFQMKRA